MRISRVLVAIAAVGAVLFAGAEPGHTRDAGMADLRWENFDDPSFEPGRAQPASAEVQSPSELPTPTLRTGRGHVVTLGAVAFDSEGRRGRIHLVAQGDTLWDISEAYLGTPWVWPSVWRENEDIANPHLIVPDDRIWISSTEMRRITKSEADALLANRPPDATPASDAGENTLEQLATLTPGVGDAASLSLAAAPSGPGSSETGRRLSLPWRENFGFVSDEVLEAASSIVGSPSLRTWLGGNDLVYLGLGQGEVEVGQDFTVFREAEEIRDARSDVLIGYHVDVLGWARVVEVKKESAIARIWISNSEMARGDRVMPREQSLKTVALKRGRRATDGQIVYLPASRTVMGMGDYVYVDRGELHGLEVGSELEIFDGGMNVADPVRRSTVHTPDEVVATMVIVDLQPTSGVAYITHSTRELQVGDLFRTAPPNDSLAQAR